MLPILFIGAVGLIAYGLSKKDRKPKDLPKKIRWNKRKDTFAKLVGGKFVKISENEFESLLDNPNYKASSRHINGVLTYTLEKKMAKGGGVEDIETSKENLSMFLSDSKKGKKY